MPDPLVVLAVFILLNLAFLSMFLSFTSFNPSIFILGKLIPWPTTSSLFSSSVLASGRGLVTCGWLVTGRFGGLVGWAGACLLLKNSAILVTLLTFFLCWAGGCGCSVGDGKMEGGGRGERRKGGGRVSVARAVGCG